MMALHKLLKPDRLTAIVDIGASLVDGNPPYYRMLTEGVCTVVGFEPNPLALEKLLARAGPNETYHDWVIGDGLGPLPFYFRQAPGMSGLHEEMNKGSLEMFPAFKAWSVVTHTDRAMGATKSLDDAELTACDLIKMDVQGYELSIIQAAPKTFERAVAVMTEVSFVPLYKDQPTFGEIDTVLRTRGFIPHCFVEAKVWPIGEEKIGQPNQLLEADVLYIKDIRFCLTGDRPHKALTAEQMKHLALLAHHFCGSFDLAMTCIKYLSRQEYIPRDAAAQYRQMLRDSDLVPAH